MSRNDGNKKQIEVLFPTSGLNRKAAYRQQAPYSTPDCLNVRAIETITSRERGGSRPGLVLSHITDLGGEVEMLSPMVLALGDGFTSFSDTFGGLTLSTAWSQASWSTHEPEILTDVPAAFVDTSISAGDIVLSTLPIDKTKDYIVEIFLVPWIGSYAGTYKLYLRMDSTPDITTSGVEIDITMSDSTDSYSITMYSISSSVKTTYSTNATSTSGVASPGWLSAAVSGDVVTIYWNGNQIEQTTVDSQTGTNVGFGLECSVDGGLCLVNVFRVQYYSTGNVNALRSMLVASANGNLFYESFYGTMTQVSTALTLRDDTQLTSAQDGQMLYIADYGDVISKGTGGSITTGVLTDGSKNWETLGLTNSNIVDYVVVITVGTPDTVEGTYKITSVATTSLTLTSGPASGSAINYRIERAPKVYDPLLNTLSILTATAGEVPTGCPLICRYLDRIVLAGAEVAPHVWYMAHVSDPTDWDYNKSSTGDVASAVSGTASNAGVPGESITALIAHSDDYLIIGCRNSLWKMIGDPANGGNLVNLSHAIGIVGPKAWCLMPDGSLLFLSMDGIYILDAIGDAYPVSVSRENLPTEFSNFDPDKDVVSMEYDIKSGGVHIFITPLYSDTSLHFYLDTGSDTSKTYGILSTTSRRTFWPFTLIADHEPTATCTLQSTTIEESGVILGSRDGFLRKFSYLSDTDCGNFINSYVVIGPVGLNKDNLIGTVLNMTAVLGDEGGDVSWSLKPSLTFEDSITSDASDSGTWSAGLNATVYPACSGQACTLLVSGNGLKWAMEQISVTVKSGGRRRIS